MTKINDIIPPEVDGELADWLTKIAATDGVHDILEVGSSDGSGSTTAIVRGAMQNPRTSLQPVRLACLEVSQARYLKLEHWASNQQVLIRPYRMSSTPPATMMSEADVRAFMAAHPDLNIVKNHTVEEVLQWRLQDISYVQEAKLPFNGIDFALSLRGNRRFDFCFLDGSAFSGVPDALACRGSRFLALDDVWDIKNFDANKMISEWPEYELFAGNKTLRNGYAIWELK